MIKDILIQKVFAEVSFDDPDSYSGGIFQGAELDKAFVIAANIVIWVGLGLVLVFLALGFIKFITSQGDKVATEQAQKWVTYAVIGGVGLLLVFSIKSVLLKLVRPGT